MNPDDQLLKFLFHQAAVRGEVVRLSASWRQMTARHDYPEPVLKLLGELTAAAALLASTIKFAGSLILQVHGDGPVALLVVECQSDLGLRATAKLREGAGIPADASWRTLVNAHGRGRCAITLEPTDPQPGQQRYQGIVPLEGDSVAEALEAYMRISEQLETRLWLAADPGGASGVLLQRLPAPESRPAEFDADGWQRVTTLAATLSPAELLATTPGVLTRRLFWQERLDQFQPLSPTFRCTCSRERIGRMLLSLGQAEVDAIVSELGEVSVSCDFCNARHAFDAVDIRRLFATGAAQEPPAGTDLLH